MPLPGGTLAAELATCDVIVSRPFSAVGLAATGSVGADDRHSRSSFSIDPQLIQRQYSHSDQCFVRDSHKKTFSDDSFTATVGSETIQGKNKPWQRLSVAGVFCTQATSFLPEAEIITCLLVDQFRLLRKNVHFLF